MRQYVIQFPGTLFIKSSDLKGPLGYRSLMGLGLNTYGLFHYYYCIKKPGYANAYKFTMKCRRGYV